MDASRPRRKKDPARRAWYARHRQWRFARHYGFVAPVAPSPPVGSAESARSAEKAGT